ncbi:MAG TPA: pilus assembly protein PilP [Methylomirabilota bacterium]|nr:pilus assembly protein PilP [Methylomirabilota bacterium]
MKLRKGPIAIAALLLFTDSQGQEKPPPAAKSLQIAPKTAASTTPENASNNPSAPEPALGKAGGASSDAKARPVAPAASQEPAGAGTQPSATIRRDPFRPFTLNLRSNVRRRENLSPLERYELGQLKLVGIVWNVKNPTALVEDSSGLGYTVKVGTLIGANDGKVKAIRPDEVVVEEEYIDLYGAKKKREVSLRLAAERLE